MSSKKLDLFALASIPLIMTLGSSMFIPVLPTIENELNISAFQTSLIISIYSIVAIILIPFSGYLSDRIGRKKVMVPSLIITAIGGGISAFAAWKLPSPFLFILIGRFIQGIGASGAFPVVIPTVGDMFKKEEDVSKGLGIIETSNTFGKVLSPIIGSTLALVIWYFPFVAIPFISLFSALLVLIFVKTPKQSDSEEPDHQSFSSFYEKLKEIFKNNSRWLNAVFLIGCISMFILFGIQFHFSNFLESRYKIDGLLRGLLLAIPLLFLCVASFVTGQKIKQNKTKMKRIILVGFIIVSVTLFLMRTNYSLTVIIILLTLAGVGIGISLPCLDSLITEGIEKAQRGTISSIYSSMRFIGVAAAPPIVAIMMDHIPAFVFPTLATLGIVAALLSIFAIKPEPNRKRGIANEIKIQRDHPTIFSPFKSK